MPTFTENIFKKILASLYLSHQDNYDVSRYGRLPNLGLFVWFRQLLKRGFRSAGLYRVEDIYNPRNQRELEAWLPYFEKLNWLYEKLADDDSRDLLVDVVSYRIMGCRHIRLPLSSPTCRVDIERVAALANLSSKLPNQVGGFDLVEHDLTPLGWPLRLFMPAGGPMTCYVLEQYAQPQHGIRVKEGDVVLDCGGCWGDTALYFSHLAGDRGRVLSFEFMAENLDIFQNNLALNPYLASRIEIIDRPVWSRTGEEMGFGSSGPGAHLMADTSAGTTHRTITIDDAVLDRGLATVDFIKMDIEGAEFEALQGARETLIRHRPDLALCVYHSIADFTRLADFVSALDLGYRFHFGHFTMHVEESVLFATARH